MVGPSGCSVPVPPRLRSPTRVTACRVASLQYLAHRISPGVLVQDIKVRNPTETDHMLELQQQGVFQWEGATVRHDRYARHTVANGASSCGRED